MVNKHVGKARCIARMQWLASAVCLVALVFSGSGCGGLGGWFEEETPCYVLSLHRFAARDEPLGRLVREVRDEDGRIYRVRHIPVMSSHFMPEVRWSADKPTQLVAYLDKRGRFMWYRTCGDLHGESLAVLLDGELRFVLPVPTAVLQADQVLLQGPWEPWEAEWVARVSQENYRLLSDTGPDSGVDIR